MKIFLMACSQRKASFNKKLIHNCKLLLKEHELDIANMEDYDMPGYNGDIEENSGVPENAHKLAKRVIAADKVILAVPEYNYSIPGVFKNIIDWMSRMRPMPWKDKKVLIINASPSIRGGHNSFWHTQHTLLGLGAHIFPSLFNLSFAHEQFDQDDKLTDPKQTKLLSTTLKRFVDYKN